MDNQNQRKKYRTYFILACVLTDSRFVKKLAEIDRKYAISVSWGDIVKPLQNIFGQSQEEKLRIAAQYWDSSSMKGGSQSDNKLSAVCKLQAFARQFLFAKAILRLHPSVSIEEEKFNIVQAAVRAFEYRQIAVELARKKLADESEFYLFCKRMKEGISVMMFGRKYGGAPTRVLQIDDAGEKLVYKTAFLNTRSIQLNAIYDVVKGHSGFPYVNARPVHRSWCLHLKILGGKIIDIEAFSSKDYLQLYAGFCRLRLLLYSKSPFFIDKFGIACRAGASVVNESLTHGIPPKSAAARMADPEDIQKYDGNDARRMRSEADKWRYHSALLTLQREYASLKQKHDMELEKIARSEELSALDEVKEDQEESAPPIASIMTIRTVNTSDFTSAKANRNNGLGNVLSNRLKF